jgi:hypothetical protein
MPAATTKIYAAIACPTDYAGPLGSGFNCGCINAAARASPRQRRGARFTFFLDNPRSQPRCRRSLLVVPPSGGLRAAQPPDGCHISLDNLSKSFRPQATGVAQAARFPDRVLWKNIHMYRIWPETSRQRGFEHSIVPPATAESMINGPVPGPVLLPLTSLFIRDSPPAYAGAP